MQPSKLTTLGKVLRNQELSFEKYCTRAINIIPAGSKLSHVLS